MEFEEVRELVKLVENSGIEELEISRKGTTIRIQKSRQANAAGGAAVIPAAVPMSETVTAPPAAEVTPEEAPAPEPERAQWKEIRSPIVGTFYRASSPEAGPFVQVGDRITEGQTLCIIEAMKVMNEIEAEFAGVIKEVLVENGQPVEAEAVLFLVDPL
jgi:acetyl-CoA carboxylase biotin carboxyl carrier protein